MDNINKEIIKRINILLKEKAKELNSAEVDLNFLNLSLSNPLPDNKYLLKDGELLYKEEFFKRKENLEKIIINLNSEMKHIDKSIGKIEKIL